jgi:hypothetical protein
MQDHIHDSTAAKKETDLASTDELPKISRITGKISPGNCDIAIQCTEPETQSLVDKE